MAKVIGNIPIAEDGDPEISGWGQTIQHIEEMFARFMQGDNSGSQFGTDKYKFMINQDTGKLALYMMMSGGWTHKVDFGSVETNWFISTVAMGGLQYRHADGNLYELARVSPLADGRSAVFGNYASITYMVSNINGAFLAYENQKTYAITVESGETVNTNIKYTIPIVPTGTAMTYSVEVVGAPNQTNKDLLCRTAFVDGSGKVLFDTITDELWNLATTSKDLTENGAEWQTVCPGWFTIPVSVPFPCNYSSDIFFTIEFKEPVMFIGNSPSNLKSKVNFEEINVERIASREWVSSEAFIKSNSDNIFTGKNSFNVVPDTTGTPSKDTDLATVGWVRSKAPVGNFVPVDGDCTVGGTKTFTSPPESSTVPSKDTQLANKKFVDDRLVNVARVDAQNVFNEINTFDVIPSVTLTAPKVGGVGPGGGTIYAMSGDNKTGKEFFIVHDPASFVTEWSNVCIKVMLPIEATSLELTRAIATQPGCSTGAAWELYQKPIHGFADWVLPNASEFSVLCLSPAVALIPKGGFWLSTSDQSEFNANWGDFATRTRDEASKTRGYGVLAIRSFNAVDTFPDPVDPNDLATKSYCDKKIPSGSFVPTSGDSVIGGVKSFDAIPKISGTSNWPSPKNPNDLVTLQYFNSNAPIGEYIPMIGDCSVSGVKTFEDIPTAKILGDEIIYHIGETTKSGGFVFREFVGGYCEVMDINAIPNKWCDEDQVDSGCTKISDSLVLSHNMRMVGSGTIGVGFDVTRIVGKGDGWCIPSINDIKDIAHSGFKPLSAAKDGYWTSNDTKPQDAYCVRFDQDSFTEPQIASKWELKSYLPVRTVYYRTASSTNGVQFATGQQVKSIVDKSYLVPSDRDSVVKGVKTFVDLPQVMPIIQSMKLGDTGRGGGIIYYIGLNDYKEYYRPCEHGMASEMWSNITTPIDMVINMTSMQRTQLMVKQDGASEGCAFQARRYGGGGLYDWAIPDMEDMQLIMATDFCPSENQFFWISNQDSRDATLGGIIIAHGKDNYEYKSATKKSFSQFLFTRHDINPCMWPDKPNQLITKEFFDAKTAKLPQLLVSTKSYFIPVGFTYSPVSVEAEAGRILTVKVVMIDGVGAFITDVKEMFQISLIINGKFIRYFENDNLPPPKDPKKPVWVFKPVIVIYKDDTVGFLLTSGSMPSGGVSITVEYTRWEQRLDPIQGI